MSDRVELVREIAACIAKFFDDPPLRYEAAKEILARLDSLGYAVVPLAECEVKVDGEVIWRPRAKITAASPSQ